MNLHYVVSLKQSMVKEATPMLLILGAMVGIKPYLNIVGVLIMSVFVLAGIGLIYRHITNYQRFVREAMMQCKGDELSTVKYACTRRGCYKVTRKLTLLFLLAVAASYVSVHIISQFSASIA